MSLADALCPEGCLVVGGVSGPLEPAIGTLSSRGFLRIGKKANSTTYHVAYPFQGSPLERNP